MKFFVEKDQKLGHRVKINIPKKIVNDAIFKELIKISKKSNINGFRKGNIPIKIIQKKYGNAVYYDVFKQLMQKFFFEFIDNKKIKVIGSPRYYMKKEEELGTEYFEYSVIYEIYPKFCIEDIKNIQVKKITANITDEDIKRNIEKNKTNIKNLWNIENNKAIKFYDRITINYDVYEKNKNLEDFNKKNIRFIIGHNTLIPQLNEKLINHFVNDIIFLKIKFHKFYPEEKLQNKDIIFKIKIVKIEKKQEIESEENILNKNIISEVKIQNIKNNFIFQINKITEQYLEDQIIQKIIKQNIIVIPPILFQEERKKIYKQYQKEFQKEIKKNILEQKYHINIDLKTKKRLSLQIIIDKIISDNKLSPDEKNVQSLIKKLSLNYKNPIEIINLYNKNQNLQNTIKNIDLENQAINLLKKSIQIIKKNYTFNEFINYKWKNYEELTI
ncbi:trigger factor [Buchnera aphidicola]|uniref:Trigger factor n=1 Tax=Buchnera aphidicola (Artemisaphis artemisicola) TaxID=1241836 RepID=A0A4D6XMB9_9GAMM|nr:trigger factor [Buchnera aphidicola]QCI16128.1 trigger factor [Buchnera aphidicola (Artemisaphis artemisicola)]